MLLSHSREKNGFWVLVVPKQCNPAERNALRAALCILCLDWARLCQIRVHYKLVVKGRGQGTRATKHAKIAAKSARTPIVPGSVPKFCTCTSLTRFWSGGRPIQMNGPTQNLRHKNTQKSLLYCTKSLGP